LGLSLNKEFKKIILSIFQD